MGYRRGVWFARSGIQEDSIVAIKGIRIERQLEGTPDWVGHVFDDSSIVVGVVYLEINLFVMYS
jgi:hypothetical protein